MTNHQYPSLSAFLAALPPEQRSIFILVMIASFSVFIIMVAALWFFNRAFSKSVLRYFSERYIPDEAHQVESMLMLMQIFIVVAFLVCIEAAGHALANPHIAGWATWFFIVVLYALMTVMSSSGKCLKYVQNQRIAEK